MTLKATRILTASGLEIARMIREGEVTSREAVETHITRARAVNPSLNAIVAERFEQALAEADAADAALAKPPKRGLPPYHGVPCTIKECFELTGMPNSTGVPARKHLRASTDAPTVALLRAAGAIPLGVTNTSEVCMWMESSNRVYGRTNNPYDPTRIVGGSSGGEGAIVGSGASPFGLGSDVGGSIRMPCFFNGIFGLKPSPGVVSNLGQYPPPPPALDDFLGTGPMCRRAEDLYPLLKVLAKPGIEVKDPATVEIPGLRVLHSEGNGLIPVRQELLEAQRSAVNHLSGQGAQVQVRRFPEFRRILEHWSAHMHYAGEQSFCQLMGNGVEVNPFAELGKWLLGQSEHTFPAIALGALERLPLTSPGKYHQLREETYAMRERLNEALGENGVMLFPSHPWVAPKHHLPVLFPIAWLYTATFNALSNAVAQVPLGLNRRGIPLGVQVVSRPGNEHLCIAVALELERAFGGWVPPWQKGAAAR